MSMAMPFSLRSVAPKLHSSSSSAAPRLYLFAGYGLRYKSYYNNKPGKRELQTSTAFRPHGLPDGVFPFHGDLSNVTAQEVHYTPPSPSRSSSAQAPVSATSASSSSSSSKSPSSSPSSSLADLFANASASAEKHKTDSKPLNSKSSSPPSPSFASATSPTPSSQSQPSPQPQRPRRKLRPRKAAISLTPSAVSHIRDLLEGPNPRLLRIGVKNRGCSGLSYMLDYVEKPGAFDEIVEQDGVKVLIDSKALFSIIGSEMDWEDKKLSSKFVFKNPNIKHECGCGESFAV